MVTNWVDRRSSILQLAAGSGAWVEGCPNGISLSAELTSALVVAALCALEKCARRTRVPSRARETSRLRAFATPSRFGQDTRTASGDSTTRRNIRATARSSRFAEYAVNPGRRHRARSLNALRENEGVLINSLRLEPLLPPASETFRPFRGLRKSPYSSYKCKLEDWNRVLITANFNEWSTRCNFVMTLCVCWLFSLRWKKDFLIYLFKHFF